MYILLIIGVIIVCIFNALANKQAEEVRRQDHEKHVRNIQERNRENKMDWSLKQSILSEGIDLYNNAAKDIQQVLDMYYGIGIIYPKYRNFVAISSIYEYFASGRCNSTDLGVAYNMFETEQYQHTVVVSLEKIKENLEEIKTNQYMIYQAIKSVDKQIFNMNYTINNMMNSMQHFARSHAAIAYNTSVTAKNTEYANWLNTHIYYKSSF